MVFLYNIALQFYLLIIKLIQPFNAKASLWLEGRLTVWNDLDIHLTANKKPVIWVHCSSLGEFEQGRPIIEALNKHFPQYQVLLSFFSPSGYEATKHFNKADHIFYLPIDTAKNAERLIKKLKPVCVFFIKYDYWYHYLHQAKKQAIPVVLVSGIFRKNQPFFQWYGGLHKKMLACFSNFYVQNNESKELLASIGFNNNVWVTGDTRFDRVVEIAGNFEPIPPIEIVVKQKKVFVAGSTWLHDDALIAKFCKLHPQFVYIIAPHDVSNKRIQECLNIYPNACLWTDIEKGGQATNVIIINTIGLLSKLYYYAHICYVGGGFGSDGVHNVAEAA
ncbi:MAG: 3-deoxy-D-manno-octulosonic acid transferase, partial [Chitinophagaceae bacterium]